jgi:hypothetical protein
MKLFDIIKFTFGSFDERHNPHMRVCVNRRVKFHISIIYSSHSFTTILYNIRRKTVFFSLSTLTFLLLQYSYILSSLYGKSQTIQCVEEKN